LRTASGKTLRQQNVRHGEKDGQGSVVKLAYKPYCLLPFHLRSGRDDRTNFFFFIYNVERKWTISRLFFSFIFIIFCFVTTNLNVLKLSFSFPHADCLYKRSHICYFYFRPLERTPESLYFIFITKNSRNYYAFIISPFFLFFSFSISTQNMIRLKVPNEIVTFHDTVKS
jgi:hypothetical protein